MDSDAQPGLGFRAAEHVRVEAAALEQIAQRLEGSAGPAFQQLVDRLAETVAAGHRIALCGIGKSGLIARKIAATFVSLGAPAFFLHPTEALHGDLGVVRRGDALLALSYSGETEEVLRLLPVLARLGVPVLSFCGCTDSPLARGSELTLDISVDREACTHQLAPTASTTAMLALGDALAIELGRCLGFAPQTFAELHPGGQLGRRLTPVRQLMHTGDAVPAVAPAATLAEIMHEMSAKRLGITTVQRQGALLGVLSDGDLRRLMEREGPLAFHRCAGEVMNAHPRTLGPEIFAADALEAMERHKITALLVTDTGSAAGVVLGVLHMHDLVEALRSPAPGA